MNRSLLRLPIDQYERYRLIADVADRCRVDGRPLRILDVGGRTGLLLEFLPRDEIVRVDREASDVVDGLVLGDGAELPFGDGAFDLVVACDTLEHVPVEDRQDFVEECARVSAKHVVLVGPFASTRVRDAEAKLREFLKQKLALDHRYLNEHADHGLPRRSEVQGWFEAVGASTATVGHGNLSRWLALMCLEIYLESDPDLQRFAPSFYEFYNSGLYALDAQAPVYRHAVVVAVEGALLPRLDDLFGSDQEGKRQSPPELFEAILKFAPDVGAFDNARRSWSSERQAFRETIAELERELGAHRSEREGIVSGLTGERSSFEATIQTLEGDLEQHREVIGELESEVATLREESAQVSALREREWAGAESVIERLREELGAAQDEIASLGRLRSDERLELDRLGELRTGEAAQAEAVIIELRESLQAAEEKGRALEELRANEREELERIAFLRRDEHQQAMGSIETLREDLQRERAEHERLLVQLAEQRAGFEGSIANLRKELEAEHEQFERISALREGELADRKAVTDRAEGLERQCRELAQSSRALDEELEQARADLARARSERESAKREHDVAAVGFGQQLAELERRRTEAEAALRRMKDVLGGDDPSLRRRLIELDAQLEKLREQVRAAEAERVALVDRVDHLRAERDALVAKVRRLQLRVERLQHTISTPEAGPRSGSKPTGGQGADLRSNRQRSRRRADGEGRSRRR